MYHVCSDFFNVSTKSEGALDVETLCSFIQVGIYTSKYSSKLGFIPENLPFSL